MNRTMWMTGIALLWCGAAAMAGTSGPDVVPRAAFGAVDDLSVLSFGGTYQLQEREVEVHHADAERENTVIEVRHALAHVGVDLTEWITLMGTFGKNELEVRGRDAEDYHDTWGAGLQLRVGSHDIAHPRMMKGNLSVVVNGQYMDYGSGDGAERIDWDEWYIDMRLRYELFAFDGKDDPELLPYSTVFFLGPAASDIDGDFISHENAGVVVGVAAFLTRDLSVSWELQYFEKATHGVSVGYHF